MRQLPLDNVSVLIYHTDVPELKHKGGVRVKNKVRALRKVAELTQIQLSEKSGVSLPTIRRVENGRTVSVPVLMKIANALNCTLDDIVSM